MLSCKSACRVSCNVSTCGWRCCALFFPKHPLRRRCNFFGKRAHGVPECVALLQKAAKKRPGTHVCRPAPWAEAAPAGAPIRVAIAIAGGLRHWQRCSRNLATEQMLKQSPPAGIFLASWFDRESECVLGLEHGGHGAAEAAVRKSFYKAGLALNGLWLGEYARLNTSILGPDPESWHLHLYSQYVLWERALSLVGPEYDVIVKTRPDAYLYTYLTKLSWHRDAATGQFMMSLLGQPMLVRNSSIFAFVSPYVEGAIDDTVIIGTASAVRLAAGDKKRSIDAGEYAISDAQYWERSRVEMWSSLLDPDPPRAQCTPELLSRGEASRPRCTTHPMHPAAWRSPSAESFFLQHLFHRRLSVYCLGGRALLMNVETCSRCLLPNGTGMMYGHWSRRANISWSRVDEATPLTGPRRSSRRRRFRTETRNAVHQEAAEVVHQEVRCVRVSLGEQDLACSMKNG